MYFDPDMTKDVVLHHNVFNNNTGIGFKIRHIDSLTIYNNTLHNNSSGLRLEDYNN